MRVARFDRAELRRLASAGSAPALLVLDISALTIHSITSIERLEALLMWLADRFVLLALSEAVERCRQVALPIPAACIVLDVKCTKQAQQVVWCARRVGVPLTCFAPPGVVSANIQTIIDPVKGDGIDLGVGLFSGWAESDASYTLASLKRLMLAQTANVPYISPPAFAYRVGGNGPQATAVELRLLALAGTRACCVGGFGHFVAGADPLQLPRIELNGLSQREHFETLRLAYQVRPVTVMSRGYRPHREADGQ